MIQYGPQTMQARVAEWQPFSLRCTRVSVRRTPHVVVFVARTQTLPSYTYKRFAGVLGECNSSAKGSNLSKSPYAIFRGRQHPLLSLDLTPVVTRLSFRRPGVLIII